ncbi:MAG: hypothetical protein JNG89_00905 [Planctomycetaceae bacterium]|nr:hypothetical protein [Planctomycetaceae bacterium]
MSRLCWSCAPRCWILLTGIAVAAVLAAPALAYRPEPDTETKTGTVVEIKEKGRGHVIVVEIDGKQQDVPVTPKLDLQIIASGDAGFVRPGQFLTASAIMSNDKLFIKELTIQVQRRGQKTPAGRIAKVSAEAGASTLAYDVSGLITASQPNVDYPDHLDVALKTTGSSAPIMLQPGYTVTVNSGDPAMIPANAQAELRVAPLRGGRVNVVGIKVRLEQPLVAEEFFKEDGESPGSGAADAK